MSETIEYETLPVEQLPPGTRGGRGRAGSALRSYRALPEGTAMFVPLRGEQTLTWLSRSLSKCTRREPRQAHTRQDRERNGVWLWWTPREAGKNGSKPS